MTDSATISHAPRIKLRRVLLFALTGFVLYCLSAGRVIRFAPEFADWLSRTNRVELTAAGLSVLAGVSASPMSGDVTTGMAPGSAPGVILFRRIKQRTET